MHEFRILHMRIAFAVSLGRSIAIARENFEIGGQQIFIGRNAFLDASSHLYKRVYPSVRPSVTPP